MIKRNFADQPRACLALLRRAADNQSFLGWCFANHSNSSVAKFFSHKMTRSQDKIKLALANYEQQHSPPVEMVEFGNRSRTHG